MNPKYFHRILLLAVTLTLPLLRQGFAQEDTARIETQQSVTTRNQTAIGEQPATGEITDPELGDISLVMRLPRPKMFSFSTSQSLNFTTNAFLVRDNAQNAFFWNGRADLSFIPYATRNFTPRLTFEQSGGAYWRQGEPSTFDRVAPYLNALAIYNFCPAVQLSGFVRPEWQIYTNDPNSSSRQDFNLSVGTTLSWTPIEYVSFAASAAYIGNFSSVGIRRYDVVTPNVIVAARIAF